jgi:hypothetical protein
MSFERCKFYQSIPYYSKKASYRKVLEILVWERMVDFLNDTAWLQDLSNWGSESSLPSLYLINIVCIPSHYFDTWNISL